MANTRLQIGSNTNVGYFTDLSVTLINQISDVAKPDKRVSTGSLTVDIPFSSENNILFENIFEANISLQTFNPHLKTAARYLVDELTVFKGYAQLLKINVEEETGVGSYEISLVGELLNIYTDIQGRLLTDLDFSAYDHDLTYAEISGSWGALGSGFTYPNIDWGTNNSNLSTWRPTDFRACYFAKEYVDKIFQDANYTYTSSFLSGSFFSHLLIPPTKAPVLDPAAVLDGKFLAVANGSQTITIAATNNQSNLTGFAYSTLNNIAFQTETYDQNNIFATPDFTVPFTDSYNLKAALGIKLVAKRNAVDVTANVSVFNDSGIHIILRNVTTSTDVFTYDLNVFTPTFAVGSLNNTLFQGAISLNNTALISGHVYRIVIKFASVNLSHSLGTGTWTLETTIQSGSLFSAELVSDAVFEGATVPGNSLIPQGVRQSDFLTGIIKMFNLYVMVDKDNPRNYIIEPRSDFYLSTPVDWTDKHDYNSNTEIKPLAELDFKDYRFTYKSDGDYFNKLYSDYYKNKDGSAQVYGTHEVSVTNDFLNNLNSAEVLFSATPYGQNSTSEMVVPKILKMDNNTISTFNSNIRILYYSGAITKPGLTWKFVYNGGANSVTYTSYLHAGHTDNPFAPTLDLNFGLPVKTYYTYPNLQWTTNNLFNAYYSQYFNQITDKNSRLVITDFYLTPTDINRFDFRKPIFYIDKFNNGAYYLVNKFTYNPIESNVTRVELLKLANYDPFEPDTYDNGGGGNEDTSFLKIKSDNITTGPNNVNEGNYCAIIGGDNNFIANSSTSCVAINCSTVSIIGAQNFMAVNASNKVFDSSYSNSTYNGNDEEIDVTSDTTLDMSYHKKTLRVNCTGGDITLTVDQDNCDGLEFALIFRAVGANTTNLDSSGTAGTENYVGNGFPYDLTPAQYDTFKFKVIGDTIYNLE